MVPSQKALVQIVYFVENAQLEQTVTVEYIYSK